MKPSIFQDHKDGNYNMAAMVEGIGIAFLFSCFCFCLLMKYLEREQLNQQAQRQPLLGANNV